MVNYSDLPRSFEELKDSLPADHVVSERLIEPTILLSRKANRLIACLGGTRKSKGQRYELVAPSNEHCWVVDGAVVRPLPRDAATLFADILADADPTNLSFAKAIQLIRAEDSLFSVNAARNVLQTGNEAAKQNNGAISIAGLEAKLFPYQARGVQWMNDTITRTNGLILADEMGLGKTLQIIALLLISPPQTSSPALIVCPTSLIANWVREIERFAPTLSYMVHRGAHRTGIVSGLQSAQVVITTYDTLVNDVAVFTSMEWSWVICDEAQAIKNPSSNRRKALAAVPRRCSIPMTGTPVENSLMDLWSLADFAVPGLLGTKTEFEFEFPDSLEAAQQLGQLTDPIILKRRVSEVAADLPERLDIDIPLELDDRLVDHYREVRQATLAKYPVAGALVATLQLQLLCAHPWLRKEDDGDEENASLIPSDSMPITTPKVERALDLLSEAFRNGRKVLVFSLFNKIGEILKTAGSELPSAFWGAINGGTAQEDRQQIVDQFAEFDGPACLVLNPKAAGAGLNITAATVVIHFTPVWNPALEMQASARAHRRGQTEPVSIYRLFYKETVEEVMIERSAWKQDLANETVPVSTRDAGDLNKALEIMPRKQ
ncbi:DEAD/DEAH box helicase [Ruegeria sp. HKCCA6707]|uniref:DEAD/DEAH box helicase n=1 Tax=Ruegeria sp. HKCCA6707 TaxID=2682996 RepID=UPI0014896D05|nr:DEAD/DEAH box helicase [Ruegeria sp. HKCCA6707]